MASLSAKYAQAKDADFLEQVEVTSAAKSVVDLHRSNLLRLQTTELVEEARLSIDKVSWRSAAEEYVALLSSWIAEIKSSSVSTEESLCPRLADKPLSFALDSVLTVQPTESYAAGGLGLTQPSSNAGVLPILELLVKIPSSVFEPKDYLRHRYFDKRNAIVSKVAQHLSKQQQAGKVYIRYHCGDRRKPILLVEPPTQHDTERIKPSKKKRRKKAAPEAPIKLMKKLRFRVQLSFGMADSDWIPPLRLLPNRANLPDCASTPAYNYALTEDMSVDGMDDIDLSEYPHFAEALVLAKIWALQRGLLRGHDTMHTTHLGLLLLYLYRTKQANPRLAPPQVLAALFKLLSETDWLGEKEGAAVQNDKIRAAPSEGYQDVQKKSHARDVLVLPEEGRTINQTLSLSDIGKLYEHQTRESPLEPDDPPKLVDYYRHKYTLGPVFLDPTLVHNYFGRLSPFYMRTLQMEARRSLECLHAHAQPFRYLFMAEARFWSRYDAYLQLPLAKVSSTTSPLWGQDRGDVGEYESIARGVVDVLRRALGDRVQAIGLLTSGNGPVNVHGSIDDSDEVPSFLVSNGSATIPSLASPTGSNCITIGLTLNTDTCFRVVDRGPPADDTVATEAFRNLWGNRKAQLRRFKDGAIVYAVVWDATLEDGDNQDESSYIRFQNDDKLQGGIVERCCRHILGLHFLGDKPLADLNLEFSLRGIMSTIDGVLASSPTKELALTNPLAAHSRVMQAFDALSEILRKSSAMTVAVPGSSESTSHLGLPLTIDAVEPLSPALRYAEVFPPLPHPWLGSTMSPGDTKVAGAVTADPIEIQIRFGASSKWPTDLKAMGAAKTAMLLSIVDGIKSLKSTGMSGFNDFYAYPVVAPSYADIGFRGYVFRVRVRADPELRLLRKLFKPSPEAAALLQDLTKQHVVAAMHHSMVHAVFTKYPSSSSVARVAKRWVACHLLSGHIPSEAIELLIAYVYTSQSSPTGTPGTVSAGFLRFLQLLGHFDWDREPLIVDPHGAFGGDDLSEISKQFEKVRGPEYRKGPAMYIVTPYDSGNAASDNDEEITTLHSAFTAEFPERVVLSRATRLASNAYAFLRNGLRQFDQSSWSGAFGESAASFRSYSALLRVDPDFVFDSTSSSTATDSTVRVSKTGGLESIYTVGMRQRSKGPKALQRKVYRNMIEQQDSQVLMDWRPIDQMVDAIRSLLGHLLLVFYNHLSPDVVALLWRPVVAQSRAFSAMASEYARPVVDVDWQKDTLVTIAVGDVMRSVSHFTADIVVGAKVLDHGLAIESAKRGRRTKVEESESDSE